ncbi:hypothetical protein BV22DRAFT_1038268 [Leucogyrophana mollusca]|uniref:Uncharacterized protein n=1 Tax=Leucogyrophana mollusca TaxID=85980 RepID=A0ACB8B7S4_9AGAM|nr:hypothetical protein BV22DRAFT_1038268 [Leucogyrophana mollusca]
MTREAFWRPLLRYFRDKARNAWGKREGALAIVLLPAFIVYQYFRRFQRFLAAHQTVFQAGPFWRMVTHRGAPVDFGLTDVESSPTSAPLTQTPLKLGIPFRPADKLPAPAIAWLIETSTDPEVIATAARMVPDVEWPVELDISPAYRQLCDAFKGCFVSVAGTSGEWQLAPLGRGRALACGKALVHLYCNRLYLEFKPYWRGGFWNPRLAPLFACLRCDCYDRSAAFICDIGFLLFCGPDARFPQVPDTCYTWVSHLLPHVLSTLPWHKPVTQWAVEVTIGLVTRPFPPRKILADCLLSAAIVMGIDVDKRELVKFDKSLVAGMLLRRTLQILPTACRITEAPMNVESHAMRLLQPLSLCFDAGIEPDFGACESKECGCEVIEWGWHTCQSIVGKLWSTSELSDPEEAMSEEERSEMWRTARAALHLSASMACCGYDQDNFSGQWTRWRPNYGGHRGRPVIDGPVWAIRFLNEHYDVRDPIAVADTFTMLSQARDIHQWADSPAFVGAIIRAMGPDQPTRIRHSALRAAWEIRNALGCPKDAIRSLLPDFIAALHSAVTANLDPPDSTTITDSVNRFIDLDRDLCYLQIVFALTQNSGGVYDGHLRDAGHFHRCLDVAKHTRVGYHMLPVYLIAIVETLQARDTDRGFFDTFDLDLRSRHHNLAWGRLYFSPGNRIQEHEQALTVMITSMRKCREANANTVPRDHVQGVHNELQGYKPDTSVISPLAELLASWPKDERC